MRRIRPALLVFAGCAVVLVVGVVVYGTGRHGLGGAMMALALLGFGFLIAPALSPHGRGVDHEGVMGRRVDVGGFDRPRDQSGL